MWYQKRNSASRRSSELRQLNADGFVRHISVEQWLGSQPRNAEQYAQDIWYVLFFPFPFPSFVSLNVNHLQPHTTINPILLGRIAGIPFPFPTTLSSKQALMRSHYLDVRYSAICLSTLALRSDPVSRPEPALIRHTSFCPSPFPPAARLDSGQAFAFAADPSPHPHPDPDPDPGWDSHSDPDPDDLHDEQITVLSGCKHAFHESCLASWFEYQQNKCPMCQTPYFPAD